jgi:uncharacterized membrane protein YfcA
MSALAGLDPGTALVVGLVALLAATLAGVTGFGGAVVLLPVLVWAVGPRLAIPVLTVAQLAGNLARVAFNGREIEWRVATRFCLGAVPAAVAGALAFAAVPVGLLTRALGLFLLACVAYRWLRPGPPGRFPLAGFLPLGAVFGFLSAVLGSVGPMVAPFFLAYGLVKGAYIGTEALGAAALHLTKTAVYGRLALLDGTALLLGGGLGLLMIAGSYLGKRVLDRLPAVWFARLIEVVLIVAGLQLLIAG